MNKVITINLNGNAYQLEEAGYEALSRYLRQAESRLRDNPDREEIMADFEQAIAEKCDAFLGGRKSVVTEAEVGGVIAGMGPVEGGGERTDAPSGTEAASAKRLYQIREGAMISGVCNGLATYFSLDVVLVRIAFIILALLTHGSWVLVYLVLALFLPHANTAEQKAAARGEAFNAAEILDKARGRYASMDHAANWEHVRQFGSGTVSFIGRLVLFVVLIWAWIAAIWSIAVSGTLFGYYLNPAGHPLLGALLVTTLFFIIFWPLKVSISLTRQGLQRGAQRQTGSPLGAALGWFVWVLALGAFIVLTAIASPQLHNLFSSGSHHFTRDYNYSFCFGSDPKCTPLPVETMPSLAPPASPDVL